MRRCLRSLGRPPHRRAEAVKKTVATTRNYKEILDRKDVDAVIVAVTDHQHRRVVVDACAAGKDVYCEKPLSHTVDDGFAMIAAAQKYNRIMQVGSQRVSSILYEKAREIYASGVLGDVCNIDAYWDRNSASGAWVYPIPPGVNEQNIDWTAFLTGAPNIPFDPTRFFRWRCFTDYGEGLAGDLFVHLISGIMFITGTNMVASRAQSSGGLFRWKDGRQFPDLIETMYDYPELPRRRALQPEQRWRRVHRLLRHQGNADHQERDAHLHSAEYTTRNRKATRSWDGPRNCASNTSRSGSRNILCRRHSLRR